MRRMPSWDMTLEHEDGGLGRDLMEDFERRGNVGFQHIRRTLQMIRFQRAFHRASMSGSGETDSRHR